MPSRLALLEEFYETVARLTLRHESIHIPADDAAQFDEDYAVVWPKDLGAALEKVDPKWVERVK